MDIRRAPLIALAATALLGATCKGTEKTPDPEGAVAAPSKPRNKEAQAAPPPPIVAISDLEGIGIETVAPEQRQDVLRLLSETYAYCGCPRSVASCLSNRSQCSCVQASDRMAKFVVSSFADGLSAEDVEAELLSGFSEGYNGKPLSFDIQDHGSKGAEDAKFTIVEFADFRCSHCKAAAPLLQELVKARKDVRLVYFYFPLSGGGEKSIRACEVAEFARANGKFWEMWATLYQNQHAMEDEDLARYATSLGLDAQAMASALEKKTYRERVLKDKRTGEGAGVISTPTLYINGRRFGLARTKENLEMRLAMEEERGTCR